MSANRFEPSEATVTGFNADIYFERTRQVLVAEEVDPVVAVEVFARASSVLCGMREVHALLRRVLPEEATVWSLEEGARIDKREVVLGIRAPYASFCLYETAILGTLASETGWATAAQECIRAADGIPSSTSAPVTCIQMSADGWSTRPVLGVAPRAPHPGALSLPVLTRAAPCHTA